MEGINQKANLSFHEVFTKRASYVGCCSLYVYVKWWGLKDVTHWLVYLPPFFRGAKEKRNRNIERKKLNNLSVGVSLKTEDRGKLVSKQTGRKTICSWGLIWRPVSQLRPIRHRIRDVRASEATSDDGKNLKYVV